MKKYSHFDVFFFYIWNWEHFLSVFILWNIKIPVYNKIATGTDFIYTEGFSTTYRPDLDKRVLSLAGSFRQCLQKIEKVLTALLVQIST